jgi:hypothetical protein
MSPMARETKKSSGRRDFKNRENERHFLLKRI